MAYRESGSGSADGLGQGTTAPAATKVPGTMKNLRAGPTPGMSEDGRQAFPAAAGPYFPPTTSAAGPATGDGATNALGEAVGHAGNTDAKPS